MSRKASIKVGDFFTNHKDQTAKVVEYNGATNVVIVFQESGVRKKVSAQQLRSGKFTERVKQNKKKIVEQPEQETPETQGNTGSLF